MTADNWTNGVQGPSSADKALMRSLAALGTDTLEAQTAQAACQLVLSQAGACLPKRDTIDKRILWEVSNGTATYGRAAWGEGKGIIDSQNSDNEEAFCIERREYEDDF